MSSNGQPPTPPTIVRRNHGRGHSYTINGGKLPGATTVLGDGYPKPAIARWAARTCAQEVIDYWDELAELLPSDRGERVRTAPDRDRDAAARRGTEVHRLAQRLQAGDEVEVPDELEGHVDAYLRFADEWQPDELFVEAPVANLTWGYSGTPDIVADLAGERWLLDLKTTRSGIFAEAALQLAAYRYAQWIVGPDGGVVPMPAVDRAGAVWLKADRTFDLVEVDAGPDTFRTFLYVLKIAQFTKRDDVIGEPLKVSAA